MDGDDWFTLAELTKRLGGLVWVEERLADLLTGWSRADEHAPSAIFFATSAGHHAWHGEVMRSCLPTSPELLDPDPVAAPTAGWEASIATLGDLDAPEATSTRLKALARVIDPWLEREIGALLELGRPVSDAAIMRWLRFSAIDHHDDGEAASHLLASRASEATTFDDHLLISSLRL